MKGAVVSLGSKSSLMVVEAMKKYFTEVDSIDIRNIEVNLKEGGLNALYQGEPIKKYGCIYTRGSFRYAPLLRSLTNAISKTSYIPIRPETFTIGHDKLLTHLALQQFKIPMPGTYITSSTNAAKKILNEITYPIVIKFPHGTQGKGIMFAESFAAASSMLDALFVLKQPFLIQEYVETGGVDIRAIVVGGKVVASMKRHAVRGEMRASIHAGAKGEACELDGNTSRIAINTAHSIGAEICAVDILEGSKGPLVIEANLSPGLQGITSATGIDVADKIASYLYEKSKEFNERIASMETSKIMEDLGVDEDPAQQIVTHLEFRGDRILLPKISSDSSELTEKDETIIKSEKGKVSIEKID
tara:strand:+ start:27154 stop:28230 length:1077 start_codon:yes stop_codon:yes gene_type:complete